jgi:hypothetical protein
VCACARVWVCAYVCMRVCARVWVCAYARVRACVCACGHTGALILVRNSVAVQTWGAKGFFGPDQGNLRVCTRGCTHSSLK